MSLPNNPAKKISKMLSAQKAARTSKARAVAQATANRQAVRATANRKSIESRINALETKLATETIDAAQAAVAESTGIPRLTIRKWAATAKLGDTAAEHSDQEDARATVSKATGIPVATIRRWAEEAARRAS